ncbi:MAG: hypothetical protein QM820_21295 [Minicystis sp.]
MDQPSQQPNPPQPVQGPHRTPLRPEPRLRNRYLAFATALMVAATLLVFVNFMVWSASHVFVIFWYLFLLLAVVQCLAGFAAVGYAILHLWRENGSGMSKLGAAAVGFVGLLVGLGGPIGLFFGYIFKDGFNLGGAWGRPLRLRGRILHPNLRGGADWTRGDRPNVTGLDAATRAALEALWLHDAQKEHASVPAFGRIGWLLAAVGAPAELLEGAHQAAMEEIDHARRCFALAAGYGGRSHSVEAMPDLLVGGLDLGGDPRVVMAVESLQDGCLLEDFNADVAARCAEVCMDPAVKDVLLRIAREERSHAEFSWQVLAWLLDRGGDRVLRAVEEAMTKLGDVPRPTAVSGEKLPLVERANPDQLRAHGRIPDEIWARLWSVRLSATEERVRSLVSPAIRLAA